MAAASAASSSAAVAASSSSGAPVVAPAPNVAASAAAAAETEADVEMSSVSSSTAANAAAAASQPATSAATTASTSAAAAATASSTSSSAAGTAASSAAAAAVNAGAHPDDDKEAATASGEAKRASASWTPHDIHIFYDSLALGGRDWDRIGKRLTSKTKDQIRYYYYRMLKRVKQLLMPDITIENNNHEQEVKILLCYWDLRKKLMRLEKTKPDTENLPRSDDKLHKAFPKLLAELVQTGSVTFKKCKRTHTVKMTALNASNSQTQAKNPGRISEPTAKSPKRKEPIVEFTRIQVPEPTTEEGAWVWKQLFRRQEVVDFVGANDDILGAILDSVASREGGLSDVLVDKLRQLLDINRDDLSPDEEADLMLEGMDLPPELQDLNEPNDFDDSERLPPSPPPGQTLPCFAPVAASAAQPLAGFQPALSQASQQQAQNASNVVGKDSAGLLPMPPLPPLPPSFARAPGTAILASALPPPPPATAAFLLNPPEMIADYTCYFIPRNTEIAQAIEASGKRSQLRARLRADKTVSAVVKFLAKHYGVGQVGAADGLSLLQLFPPTAWRQRLPIEFEQGFDAERTVAQLHAMLSHGDRFEIEYGWPIHDTVPDLTMTGTSRSMAHANYSSDPGRTSLFAAEGLQSHPTSRAPLLGTSAASALANGDNQHAITAFSSGLGSVGVPPPPLPTPNLPNLDRLRETMTPEELAAAQLLNDVTMGFSNFPPTSEPQASTGQMSTGKAFPSLMTPYVPRSGTARVTHGSNDPSQGATRQLDLQQQQHHQQQQQSQGTVPPASSAGATLLGPSSLADMGFSLGQLGVNTVDMPTDSMLMAVGADTQDMLALGNSENSFIKGNSAKRSSPSFAGCFAPPSKMSALDQALSGMENY